MWSGTPAMLRLLGFGQAGACVRSPLSRPPCALGHRRRRIARIRDTGTWPPTAARVAVGSFVPAVRP